MQIHQTKNKYRQDNPAKFTLKLNNKAKCSKKSVKSGLCFNTANKTQKSVKIHIKCTYTTPKSYNTPKKWCIF